MAVRTETSVCYARTGIMSDLGLKVEIQVSGDELLLHYTVNPKRMLTFLSS